jgi:hypothetical protein
MALGGLAHYVGGGGRSVAFAIVAVVILIVILFLAYRFLAAPALGGQCEDPLPMSAGIDCRISGSTGDDVYSGRGGAVPVDEDGYYYGGGDFSDYGGTKGPSAGGPYGRGGGNAKNAEACRQKCTSDVANHDATEVGCVAYTWNPSLADEEQHDHNCFLWTHPPSGMKGLAGWKSAVVQA